MAGPATTTPALLNSPLLARHGIPHAFTTRRGGVSPPPFDSLNFGNPMDLPPSQGRDPIHNIQENFHRVLLAIDAPDREVTQVYQVHSARAHIFRPGKPSRNHRHRTNGNDTEAVDFKADALLTDDTTRVLAVRVADCCPILLATDDGRAVAAVHAGWRGVVEGVIPNAVDSLRRLAADIGASTRLLAAVGPCIGPARFEVGPEVVERFTLAFGHTDHLSPHPDPLAAAQGKAFVRLAAAINEHLRLAGVESIDSIPGCTASEPDRFFSHRREAGVTGRMIGVIGPRKHPRANNAR